ncbi:MAG: ribosomal protein S18-alanine N-acetyltransferase [Tissierellia bacterium]|nr:ribosomal protein S18-alanine N-acetyltransferase [Bacillota bacterium]NLK58505.1 ribosomal protein S18-alanine N-acetyltransferase [Tissierellia bacterium]
MTGQIRAMEVYDIPRVLEIEKESFTNPWSEQSFLMELENPISQMLVLETDGQIAGIICYWMVLDEIHLLNIAIAGEERGKGYARFLLHAMQAHAEENGSTSVVLEVRENNERAIRLYERFGFSQVGRIANYYPEDKQDALVMRKEMKWTNR